MAYASASDVAALCRNLLGNASNFDNSTSPNLTQVNAWLSAGCALINTTIFGRNYNQAVPVGSAAYEFMTISNAQFAAWQAERSRTLASVQATERTRADTFKRDFMDSLDMIKTMSLGQAGVGQSTNVYMGGLTNSDKSIDQSDSNMIGGRFSRGMLSDPARPDEQERADGGGVVTIEPDNVLDNLILE